MTIILNGEQTVVDDNATVADVLRHLGRDPQRPGVAVAVGGRVVRRTDWSDTRLQDGAVVEVVTAVQGGC